MPKIHIVYIEELGNKEKILQFKDYAKEQYNAPYIITLLMKIIFNREILNYAKIENPKFLPATRNFF